MYNPFKKKLKHIPIKQVVVKKELGNIFKLSFGDTVVMNHWVKDFVYIENVFGEQTETFTDALQKIDAAIVHGVIVPDKIKVICVCKREIEGRYLELRKIVEAINNIQNENNNS